MATGVRGSFEAILVRKNELTVEGDCLMWEIPVIMRNYTETTLELHRTKSFANCKVFVVAVP